MVVTSPVECGDSDCKTWSRGCGDRTCFGHQYVSTEYRGIYWAVLRGGVTEIPLERRYCSNVRGDEVVKGIKVGGIDQNLNERYDSGKPPTRGFSIN